jgi:hypothetical protein
MKLVLRLPTEDIENPSLQTVIEKLDTTDPAFWDRGSGDAGLEGEFAFGVARLVIIGKNPHGFFLQHTRVAGDADYVAVSGDDYSITTKVVVGGEPWVIPIAFFVDSFAMKAAVRHFVETGERLADLKWVKIWEQDWKTD